MRRKRDSLSSIVASAISEKIRAGVYTIGSKIPVEMQLCDEYNVSRTVVREAIAQLRSEGLLRSQKGVGVFVADDGSMALKIPHGRSGELTEILKILELRLGVEIEAAGLAASRNTPETLKKYRCAHGLRGYRRLYGKPSRDGFYLPYGNR